MLDQVGVQRQHHERQIAVHDADIGGGRGIDQLQLGQAHVGHQRLQAGVLQELVEQAVAVQDRLPGIDADQERSPRRQHHQHHRHVARGRRQAGDGIGHRVADQQGEEGRDRGDLDRAQERLRIDRIAKQRQVVLEIELERQAAIDVLQQPGVRRRADPAVRETDHQHDQERHSEEQQQPQVRNADHRGTRARQPALQAGGAHEVSTTPSLSRQCTHTSSPQVRPSLAQRCELAKLASTLAPLGRRTW
ncbi:hypothetical protein D3C75_191730 [compost metagenome]